jgi:hypothetical protein
MRALPVVLALGLAAPTLAAAQTRPAVPAPRLAVHAYTLRYQPASEALVLVRPLLSPVGRVDLQPGGNTIVIRDTFAALARIVPVLQSFDHPARRLRLQIQMVQAGPTRVSPPVPATGLSEALVRRMREMLRYDSYELLAQAALQALEGDEVTYQIGEDYRVSFRLGTLLADKRVKLHGFRVARAGPAGQSEAERQLIHTNLNLWLGQTMILGLTPDEASQAALLIVLTCTPETAP